ncbi:hypothetical protein [Ekhidna sp.]|uniref:hypothetical protein n=1 Tax=Ekhidna sp. TaxID=2608089 RepID=UPI0035114EAF
MKKSMLFVFTIITSSGVTGQNLDQKYAKDVESIDAIITAYYDVVSGSSNEPWDLKEINTFIQKVHLSQESMKTDELIPIRWRQNIYPLDYPQEKIFLKKN